MKTISLISIFFISLSVYSQDTSLSKKNLNHIFSQNANGRLFDWKKKQWSNSMNDSHKYFYNVWQTSNKDSLYFSSDTIVMYNYSYAYYEIDGGETIEWNFYKKNKISISEGKYNIEPPMSSASIFHNKVKIKQEKEKLILLILRENEVMEKFIVLNLTIENFRGDKEIPIYVMTLKRIKTGYNKV